MALIKQEVKNSVSYNKNNHTYYVYEVTYYLDSETGEKTKVRKVIGKQDPVTHETIPTRRYRTEKEKEETVNADLQADSKSDPYKKLYEDAVRDAKNQLAYDRNTKIQLTAALTKASKRLESVIKEASDELASIKTVLSRFGVND